MNIQRIREASWQIERVKHGAASEELRITKEESGNVCKGRIWNDSSVAVAIKEIVMFSGEMPFPTNTTILGEGYNMLSMYGGTVGDITQEGAFNEVTHYKFPQVEGATIIYNMLLFLPDKQETVLMGFSSCHRFGGQFRLNEHSLEIVLDCEGIEIQPGESIELEEFYLASGSKQALLEEYAKCIQQNHPMLTTKDVPTGWCSWPVYGPDVTAEKIHDNLAAIKKDQLKLTYIQIDDGYQPYMGDWLSETDLFQGGIEKTCLEIKEKGFEPAIWVAPFIAEKDSELFRNHPDWFIKDEIGEPLPSDRVTFGGWRRDPWYMLDGTHPGARGYLTHVFRTMRQKWKVKYFKLDANMWGAMPFGRHYEKNKTCIEAYRMGMKAILEGAGEDSFLLGCNAPMWPSLGVIHGMRVTGDIARRWDVISHVAKECFFRNWQHGCLWVNDPDTLILENSTAQVMGPDGKEVVSTGLSREEFMFNAAYILASGGMVLAGDDMTAISEENKEIIKRLFPPINRAAVFEGRDYKIGKTQWEDALLLFFFNEGEEPCDYSYTVNQYSFAADYWTGEEYPVREGVVSIRAMKPHSAVVLRCSTQK